MARKHHRRNKSGSPRREVTRSYASYTDVRGLFARAENLAADGQIDAAIALFEQLEDERGLSGQMRRDIQQALERLTRGTSENEPDVVWPPRDSAQSAPVKVAVVSFLFNWPSTGGGNIHTWELVQFLSQAGYDVQHFFPRYAPWGIGRCDEHLPYPHEVLDFDDAEWNRPEIQARIRRAVDAFDPDCVIITDSWNFKPHLAEALNDYPYFLRMQALECLCPLNNLRLLPGTAGQVSQCPRHQLSSPTSCVDCLLKRGATSGGLHQAERALSGVGTQAYNDVLKRAVTDAAAVLCLNQSIADMYRPHAGRVEVVTWGMDATRFPWPPPDEPSMATRPKRLLFAGLTDEFIKGFHVLHDACRRLWNWRRDFELIVTSGRPGRVDSFTRTIGWQSQAELPAVYRDSDICIVPTIVQDGLSRTSVEAMASGRPVIASRIGGLPETVEDGKTGLLATAGDAEDFAAKIACLLEEPELRHEMGRAGRARFEEKFTWPTVIEQGYRPLLVHKRTLATVS